MIKMTDAQLYAGQFEYSVFLYIFFNSSNSANRFFHTIASFELVSASFLRTSDIVRNNPIHVTQ